MRVIGLLGGLSYHSTLPYYRIVNDTVAAALGGHASARMYLASVNFQDVVDLQDQGRVAAIGPFLAEAAQGLARAGAQGLAIASNTMHDFADVVAATSGLPLIHIGDAVAEALRAAGHRRVALLGTRFTMEKPFMKERLAAHGLTVLTPGPADRRETHARIFQELVKGDVSPATRAYFQDVARRLADEAGAEAVVLACTEIGLALAPGPGLPPLFDTTPIHAHAIARWSLAGG